jgi:hypothetical protein
MSHLIEEIQEDLVADIAFELSRLQENQLVRLKWSGQEYIYAHREGVDVWSSSISISSIFCSNSRGEAVHVPVFPYAIGFAYKGKMLIRRNCPRRVV